jgi:hypothetical protein
MASGMRRFLVITCVLAARLICAENNPVKERIKAPPGAELFSDGRIRRFSIQIDETALQALNANNRAYVPVTVTEGSNVFRNVGLHLKGMGSFRPLSEKPSLALKFDKYASGQTYLGLSKIMLNNSSQDSTHLAELIATSMFRDAGLPAARVTHALVDLNGRDLGLYVLIEAMNKLFLKQHFKSAKGNLYEAYLQDLDQTLDQDGGEDSTQMDLKRLLEVARMTNTVARWHQLDRVLDVDRFITFVALELFASHTDGYTLNRNNYRIYHDPSTDRFVFITHGLDWGYANTGVCIWPPLNSVMVKAVLQAPQGQRIYRQRVRESFTNYFRLETLTNRVLQAGERLRNGGIDSNQVHGFVSEMNNRLVNRFRNIADQLLVLDPPSVVFGPDGSAPLTNWRRKREWGDSAMAQVTRDGRLVLSIEAANGPCVASWRTQVWLDQGRYLLQGRARAVGVGPRLKADDAERRSLKSIGAGLGVSGQERLSQLVGDSDWTFLEYPFDISSGGDQVELICELRAEQGRVLFDFHSLRLIRR